jgi:hypothetical protein
MSMGYPGRIETLLCYEMFNHKSDNEFDLDTADTGIKSFLSEE